MPSGFYPRRTWEGGRPTVKHASQCPQHWLEEYSTKNDEISPLFSMINLLVARVNQRARETRVVSVHPLFDKPQMTKKTDEYFDTYRTA